MNALDQKREPGSATNIESATLERIPQDRAQPCPGAPSQNRPIRVLVIDGHSGLCPGINARLAKLPNIATVAYAAEGRDALSKARTLSHCASYQGWRTQLGLNKDAAEPRRVQPSGEGKIVALPEVGGLHHRYERRAA